GESDNAVARNSASGQTGRPTAEQKKSPENTGLQFDPTPIDRRDPDTLVGPNEALHEPQSAAGILPADPSEQSTAGKMPAAPWRCRFIRFRSQCLRKSERGLS